MNLSLRDIPEELYQEIKQLAERERRSMNQQILVLLEGSIEQRKYNKYQVFASIDSRRERMAARSGLTTVTPSYPEA